MKKAVLGLLGAMMILSLAACTPTTEKNKTGEVKTTEAAPEKKTANGEKKNSVDGDKMPDMGVPDMDVVSIYDYSGEGGKLTSKMEALDEKTPQALVDLLIAHKMLPEGTKSLSFEAQGEPASKEVGPGIVEIPGMEPEKYLSEIGILDLNQFPADDPDADKKLQAVANTFIENMDVLNLTIQVNGETLKDNLLYVEPEV